jgi:hypothetical protein
LRLLHPVPAILGVELHLEERSLLRVAPRHDRELLRARAGVDAAEELLVARLDRAKLDRVRQLRGG